jgi:acetyl esterase/lipase
MWGMMERAAGGKFEDSPEKYRNLSLDRLIRKDNPPLFFMEADNEGLFPRHYNEVLLEQHKNFGIPSEMKVYKYAEHGFFYNLTRPIQLEAFEDIITFVNKINP